MVGLSDQNLQVNSRIRVGQDFGLIKYLGEVSHQVKKICQFNCLKNIFILI